MKEQIIEIAKEIFTKIKLRDPHTWSWIRHGIFYGYPKCCIIFFCEQGERQSRHELQSKLSNHSGFIPCKKCTTKVISENLKLEDLIQNRFCEESFIKM